MPTASNLENSQSLNTTLKISAIAFPIINEFEPMVCKPRKFWHINANTRNLVISVSRNKLSKADLQIV